MPGIRRNQNRISYGDIPCFTVDLHDAAAGKDEIKLLTELVMMSLNSAACGQRGFGEALVFHRGIREIQNAADGGAVLRRKGGLFGKAVDCHGGCGIVSRLRDHCKLEPMSLSPLHPSSMAITHTGDRMRGRRAFKPSRRFEIAGRTTIITGASSGLGAEFARQLSIHAAGLVLVARSEAALEKVAAELRKGQSTLQVYVIVADLATDAGRALMWEKIDALEIKPTLLINNAGLGDYGAFADADPIRIRAQIDVNITALTLVTHGFLSRVQTTAEKPAGMINISSLASALPIPDFAVYAATKAYVTSFSEALTLELADQNIQVTCVCPGPTPTNFGATAQRSPEEDIDRTGQDLLRIPPERVVAEALHALAHRKACIFPSKRVTLIAFLFQKMPRPLLRLINGLRLAKSRSRT